VLYINATWKAVLVIALNPNHQRPLDAVPLIDPNIGVYPLLFVVMVFGNIKLSIVNLLPANPDVPIAVTSPAGKVRPAELYM
jgi:hypothetical protein